MFELQYQKKKSMAGLGCGLVVSAGPWVPSLHHTHTHLGAAWVGDLDSPGWTPICGGSSLQMDLDRQVLGQGPDVWLIQVAGS